MRVRLAGPLTITGNRALARYGSLDLSVGGRLLRSDGPSDSHAARRIILDDGSHDSHPDPIPYLNSRGTRRSGTRLPSVDGILSHAFGAWRIHPLVPDELEFQASNPRGAAPQRTAPLRVVGFNVNNYFRTLGERGAEDTEALGNQRQALTAVFQGLTPDLVALQEIENRPLAAADMTAMLSRATGSEWRHLVTEGRVGDDAIRSMLAWRPARIQLLEGPFIDTARVHTRPPVAGLFRLGPDDPGTLVVSFHHKSKGGCPDTGDVDRGDGCWNERRLAQSRALQTFVRERADALETDRILLVGDVNAYANEPPVAALTDGDWIDLTRTRLTAGARYSYVFRGVAGVLDTAVASPSVAERIQSVTFWRINADEPVFMGPRAGEPWRSSDHDPLILDLRH
jgi:predicted extracellular nuclease